MLPIAFTESVDLKNTIREIDEYRSRILSTPFSPKTELKLRWEAQATKIHSSLALAGQPISRGQVVKILGNSTKHIPNEYKMVISYKKALEYIQETWTANPKPVTIHTIITLANLLQLFPNSAQQSISEADGPIRATFEYLAPNTDHPIIQAGIALCLLSTSAPIAGDTGIIARLISSIFLAKYGYDVRNMLTVEKNWLSSGNSYDIALESLRKEGSLNHWLLYFSQTIRDNLSERMKDIINPRIHLDLPATFWELNDRQRTILTYVSEPGSTITNKKVQTMCAISQITASRDLSKLTTLGLLSTHGKGRSISYTRS